MPTDAAAFRSAVDDVIVEVQAENWPEARKKVLIAELQFTKLPTEQRKGGEAIRYREQLRSMLEQIDSLEASANRSGDNRRLIKMKTTFE